MATTFGLVNDQVLKKFKDYWVANAAVTAGLSSTPPILYETDLDERPNGNVRAYANILCRASPSSRPAAISGGLGRSRFERQGYAFIKIFVSTKERDFLSVAQSLAQVARDGYEGQRTDKVWFRDCRITEVGRDGQWYQVNLTIEFIWDEVK